MNHNEMDCRAPVFCKKSTNHMMKIRHESAIIGIMASYDHKKQYQKPRAVSAVNEVNSLNNSLVYKNSSFEIKRLFSLFKYIFFIILSLFSAFISINWLINLFLFKDIASYIDSLSILGFVMIIFFVIITPIIFFFVGLGYRKIFKVETKVFFMNKILNYLGNSFAYYTSKNCDKYYNDVKMLRNNIGSIYSDDYIEGIYNGIKCQIIEFGTTGTFNKQGDIDFYIAGFVPFKGILFIFDFPRNKAGLPQNALKRSKGLVIVRNRDYHFPINVGEKITLEDMEFNRIYETSGDDQIEARIVLRPAFMEKLKSFHHKGQKVACCIQNDKCYVAIQTNKDMFELPFWRSVKDIKPYREIVNQIQDILSIIDTLMG